jgi:hypothetical protein
MKHIKKRVSNIIGELTMFFFSIGATDIKIDLKDRESAFFITLSCNCAKGQEKKICKLIKALECPKGEAVEEYYWGLAGNSDLDMELTLVGMMVDDHKISYEEDSLNLTLIKNK